MKNKAMKYLVACSLAVSMTALGQSTTYTLDADFDQGTLFNVNYDVADQLQLSSQLQGFKNIWIANAGEDTLSKIDTDANKEVARYETWFSIGNHGAWTGPAPSRSAVDGSGNAYIGNRGFNGTASVLKILSTGGIDRNGNGVIDTSSDLNGNGRIDYPSAEVKTLVDLNGSGRLDNAELADERVAWVTNIPQEGGNALRALTIDRDGNVWIGFYNSRRVYKLDPNNGNILVGPITIGVYPYGAAVHTDGKVYFSSLSHSMATVNPANNAVGFISWPRSYGMAAGNGKIYTAYASPIREYNPATGAGRSFNAGFGAFGVGVDGNGDIVVSGSRFGSYRGATKLNPNGGIIWSSVWHSDASAGSTRGAIPDANGDVWTVNLYNNKVSKFRGSDGARLGTVPVGLYPYTYSDASGSGFVQANPTGTWTIVNNTGDPDNTEITVSWTADVPEGSNLLVEVRTANTLAGLEAANFVVATNGVDTGLGGQFVEVKVTFTKADAQNDSAVLYDLTIAYTPPNQPPVANCNDVTLLADDGECSADVSAEVLGEGSTDPDEGDVLTFSADPVGPYALGTTMVTVTVTDSVGAFDTCVAAVTVTEDDPPAISCNAEDITPNAVPISFTATAVDACDTDVTIEITGHDCYKVKRDGSTTSKLDSCVVEITGNTITILESGGVGTFIAWTVVATDDEGNVTTQTCEIQVRNPSNSEANEGLGNGVDGDTPGHDHNGGNDDPGTSPGNPGAKGGKGGKK